MGYPTVAGTKTKRKGTKARSKEDMTWWNPTNNLSSPTIVKIIVCVVNFVIEQFILVCTINHEEK